MSNCTKLTSLKVNNVTGGILIECDQAVLKEMGIKKIGDRVRIFVAIKALRNKTTGNPKKRSRDSLAVVDTRAQNTPYTPSSSGSPRHPPNSTRTHQNMRDRRWSQVIDSQVVQPPDARPRSPYTNTEHSRFPNLRMQGMSPITNANKEQSQSYFATTPAATKAAQGRPGTPNQSITRQGTGLESTVGRLGNGQPIIRVIYQGGQTKALDIRGCKTLEDVIKEVLKKLNLPVDMSRNYCFWTLDGTGQDLNNSHKLTDAELLRLCSEPFDRNERGRLILRKKHAGEPDEEELRKASGIALEEQNEMHAAAVASQKGASIIKLEKLTGKTY